MVLAQNATSQQVTTTIRDYKVSPSLVQEFVNGVNQSSESHGRPYRILSEDIHYRQANDGTTVSAYGRFTVYCRAGFEPTVNFVLPSGQFDLVEKLRKEMYEEGLRPVLNLDRALFFLSSSKEARTDMATLVVRELWRSCSQPSNESFFSLTFWMTADESRCDKTVTQITETIFKSEK